MNLNRQRLLPFSSKPLISICLCTKNAFYWILQQNAESKLTQKRRPFLNVAIVKKNKQNRTSMTVWSHLYMINKKNFIYSAKIVKNVYNVLKLPAIKKKSSESIFCYSNIWAILLHVSDLNPLPSSIFLHMLA